MYAIVSEMFYTESCNEIVCDWRLRLDVLQSVDSFGRPLNYDAAKNINTELIDSLTVVFLE